MRQEFPTPKELKGAIQGTVLYLCLYLIGFIQFQTYSKNYLIAKKKAEAKNKKNDGKNNNIKISYREIKYYNSKDIIALTGDRTVGNFIEQSIAFVPLLWIHAIFVNPNESFTICLLYVVFRSLYPVLFLLQMYKKFTFPIHIISTAPGQLILLYLTYHVVKETLN